MQAEAPPRPRRPLSRRQRRILWTASTLAALTLMVALLAWRIHREHAPEQYTPGEDSTDVTSGISEQAARKSAASVSPARMEVSSRVADALRDAGRKLPPGAPEPRFTDVTQAAGLAAFRQFQGPRTSQLPEDMGSGLAWGDFDNDGYEDLFVVSGGGALNLPETQLAPSLLYRNSGNGRFEQVEDFPETRIRGMAAAWGDYNNDGWLDLLVTGYDAIILYRNDHGHLVRDRRFPPLLWNTRKTDRARGRDTPAFLKATGPRGAAFALKGFWAGAAWGDYNRDGYLDLYVCGYVKYVPGKGDASSSTQQFGKEVPFTLNPASYEPERNLLFRNNGDGTFTEVAQKAGVANPEGRSLSALWHDFDGDGWLDLYVANDVSENKLYLNRHGKFTDAGRSAWVEEYRGSMGLAAGDFDRDGDDDLFISHWIAQQYALYQSLLSEQKQAGGAKLELHFTDTAEMRGIGQPSMQSIGWGAAFADFDSDGWPDLMVANGSTFERKDTSPRLLAPMASFLFWNARGEYFHDLAPWNRSLAEPHVSRGLAVADFDNDGSMDAAIVDQGEGVRLLRNDIPHGNWAELRLHSRVPDSRAPLGFGDGAAVVAWVGNIPLRRAVTSASYLSQDSRRVHIGLGTAAKIDRLEVRWLGGRAETWTNLAANRIWSITEGEREPRVFEPHRPESAKAARLVRFWEKQRAAMDAMKRDRDLPKAAQLFREALALNAGHEDSHYYLANCLAALGDVPGAIAELDALVQANPQSHRAFQRKGEILAASASSRAQLAAARRPLETALRLNSEETGTLLLLGEVALGAGDLGTAEQRFAHVCQANSRAANAWFLRGYIAWKQNDPRRTATMLSAARTALGPDWKPAGSALEGDVPRRMHSESGFLSVFAQQWDGEATPERAYDLLDQYLR
ncbi:MAG: VCBS repeat-containing protein, partial [Acidobacteria bacterium]|nr:VCBS repeat-containing protein [Acidobacteriota bacterium]